MILIVKRSPGINPFDVMFEWFAVEAFIWQDSLALMSNANIKGYVFQIPGGSNFSNSQFKHTLSPVWISVRAAFATTSGVRIRSIPSPSSVVPGWAGQKRLLSGRSSNLSGRGLGVVLILVGCVCFEVFLELSILVCGLGVHC